MSYESNLRTCKNTVVPRSMKPEQSEHTQIEKSDYPAFSYLHLKLAFKAGGGCGRN